MLDDAERKASIKATRDRISSYFEELWDVHTSGEEKAAVRADLEQHRLSWKREVSQYVAGFFRKYRAEFRAVLRDEKTGRVSPEGYLALKELQRSLLPSEEERLHAEAAAEFGRVLKAVERGREEAIGFSRAIDEVPEGFVFGPQDVPYLRKKAMESALMADEPRARREALASVLSNYEQRGELDDPYSGTLSLFGPPLGSLDLSGYEGRSFEYFRAVLELAGEPFENLTSYAKAIADRCPKEDGDTPSYQAVLDWLSRDGHRKKGQALKDFRPRLEQHGRFILRRLQRAGDGTAGNPPDVSK